MDSQKTNDTAARDPRPSPLDSPPHDSNIAV